MSKDTSLNEYPDRKKERYVEVTIYAVPESSVKEFGERILKPHYPGGISPAIKVFDAENRRRTETRGKRRIDSGVSHSYHEGC